MAIFTHTDDDGDSLEVLEQSAAVLEISSVTSRYGRAIAAYVDRDAALRLHNALGEWLYPVHTPEYANRSLIEQMIERAVRDQVAAVLPLHLSPVATARCETHCLVQHDYAGNEVIHDAQAQDDPEPHDVGHPVYEDAAARCRHCGQTRGEIHQCDTDPAPDFFGGTPMWRWGVAGVPPIECTCTHLSAPGHGRLGCSASSCTCRWTGAS